MPQIAGGMPESIGLVVMTADSAEHLETKLEDGKLRGYYLTMARDRTGIWSVADF